MATACQFCGKDIPDEAAFCGHCGARKPTAAPGAPAPAGPSPAGPAGVHSQGSDAAAAGWATPYADRPPLVAPGVHRRYAGFWLRFAAYIVDALIAIAAAIVPALVVAALFSVVFGGGDGGGTSFGVGLVVGFYATWFVYWWLTTSMGGGPGKRLFGLRVIDADTGEQPDGGSAFVRELSRVVFNLISILGLLDHLWAAWDGKKQTWHDKAGGTLVVHR